jgi:hypothetical protein
MQLFCNSIATHKLQDSSIIETRTKSTKVTLKEFEMYTFEKRGDYFCVYNKGEFINAFYSAKEADKSCKVWNSLDNYPRFTIREFLETHKLEIIASGKCPYPKVVA